MPPADYCATSSFFRYTYIQAPRITFTHWDTSTGQRQDPNAIIASQDPYFQVLNLPQMLQLLASLTSILLYDPTQISPYCLPTIFNLNCGVLQPSISQAYYHLLETCLCCRTCYSLTHLPNKQSLKMSFDWKLNSQFLIISRHFS